MKKRKVERIHYFSLAANAVATLISIILLVFFSDYEYSNLFVLVIVPLQIVSFLLDLRFQNGIISLTFGSTERKDLLLRKADPVRYKNTIQGAREELRFGLKIIMAVAVICCLAWGFITRDILKTIICLCVLGIAFMYADYIPHTKLYSKRYDANFVSEDEKPNSNRGLARIYLQEYEETHFKKRNKKYKEWLNYKENEINPQQDECIKNILRLGMDTSINYFLIFSLIITSLTAFFAIPGFTDVFSAALLKNVTGNASIISPITILAFNFVLFVLNIASSNKSNEENEYIKELANLILNGTPEERFKKYKEDFEENYPTRSRGIFVYCASYVDREESLDDIDFKYKMLFTHRLDANRGRFWSTVSMAGLALLCLLIDIGVKWIPILIIGAACAVFVIVFRFLFLDKIGKRKIIKYCEGLKQNNDKSKGD